MKYEKVYKSLISKNYEVTIIKNKALAVEYLQENICNTVVGFGDSNTLESMNLFEVLSKKNKVIDPSLSKDIDEFIDLSKAALTSDIFITSVNALAETGEMINIDGTGNRVSGSLFGHKKVFFVIGRNKLESNLDDAIFRARNIAAPMNAKRLNRKTPCAINGDKCYDCSSPDRICNALVVHSRKMSNTQMEVIIIDEDLGY